MPYDFLAETKGALNFPLVGKWNVPISSYDHNAWIYFIKSICLLGNCQICVQFSKGSPYDLEGFSALRSK